MELPNSTPGGGGGRGIDICAWGLFCTKFDSKQFSFEAFLDVMLIYEKRCVCVNTTACINRSVNVKINVNINMSMNMNMNMGMSMLMNMITNIKLYMSRNMCMIMNMI